MYWIGPLKIISECNQSNQNEFPHVSVIAPDNQRRWATVNITQALEEFRILPAVARKHCRDDH